ncbi:MAG: hypothetical protein RL624_1250 [Bacteroidota bacterium]|jgi:hypothetical protein
MKSELIIINNILAWANEFTSSVDAKVCLLTQIRHQGVVTVVRQLEVYFSQ